LTEIGKDILPSVISAIKAVVDGFTSLDPNTQKGILGFIAFIAVLGPFLVIVGSMISTLGTVIKLITGIPALVGAVGKAFMALGPVFTFISANPIVLVIAAIIAVIALLAYIVVKNWDTIKAAFKAGFDFISGVVTGIVTFLGNMGSKIIKAIVKPFKDAKEAIAKIANDIKEAANNINPFVRHSPSLVDNVKKGIGIIQNEYASLRDVKLPGIMASLPTLSEPAYASAGMGSVGGSGFKQDVNINIDRIQNQSDIDALGREFGFRQSLLV
jgi:phage-related protein